MGGTVLPPCSLAWGGPDLKSVVSVIGYRLYGRYKGNLLQKDLRQHAVPPRTTASSALDPAAGHCKPMHLLQTPEHSQASLAQSLLEAVLLLLGPGEQKALSVPSKSLFPQSCGSSVIKSCWLPKSGSLPLCWISMLGSLLQGLELSQECKSFFVLIFLQSVECPPSGSVVGLIATSSRRT